jgi:hypothetical protein
LRHINRGGLSQKILNGAKPAEMPVEQTTRVDFAINMKTAKKLGLVFPIPLLGLADEVIELRQSMPHRTMSAFGTKRTSQWAQPMSAFGGKADIVQTSLNVRL